MMNDESDFVKGLMLLLTSRVDECEAHFTQNINNNNSPVHVRVQSTFGHALVAVIRALISFEDEDKNEALARLVATQKLVQGSIVSTSGSWFAPFGSSDGTKSAVSKAQQALSNLDLELIGADAGLFLAMIQFTQESAMGVMRGALTLRKSYKAYQKASKEVRELAVVLDNPNGATDGDRRRHRGSSVDLPPSTPAPREPPPPRWTTTHLILEEDELFFDASPTEEDALGGDPKTGYGPLITRNCTVMDRVVASSKMGTGLFHLAFSLIPPRFLTYIGAAMGFESTADRAKGLRYLRSCVDQGTSRSPLAALVLLAFHSAMMILARGVADDADSQEAFIVLDACLRQYPDSPLFRFFEGRLYRGKGKLKPARESFEIAQKCSRNIHQMSYLCLCRFLQFSLRGMTNGTGATDERAWCAGLLGSAREAGTLFLTIAKKSPWAPGFYGYLGACYYYEQAFRILCLTGEDIKSLSVALRGSCNNGDHPDDEARKLLRQALAWFRTVPNLGKKRAPFPPEKFAHLRCAEINPLTTKYAGKQQEGSSSGSSSSGVSLEGVAKDTLLELATGLFWPSMELAYFWNGFFQIENKAHLRKELEQSMAIYRQHQKFDQDPVKKHNFQSMYRLFRGAILREERQYAAADAELALLIPHPDYQVPNLGDSANIDKWTIEFGKYERGLCQWELGDRKQATTWWNAVKDSGHPLDARLRFRLRSALRKAQSST